MEEGAPWWRGTFRRAINAVIRFLSRALLVRVDLVGLENIPPDGPTIFIINHVNFMDGPLVLAFVPREMTAMTKAENMVHPILGPLARWYGIFGVRRGEVHRDALDRAVKVLQGGTALLYSPEGHRSGHGRLQRARHGIAHVAARARARIVPVAFSGLESFWPNLKRLRATRVRMELGQPFSFAVEPAEALPLREMTSQLMYRLARMLPERNRGIYADLSQASEHLLRFDTTR